ncbi:T9SS type A sorting domain-containing protein, partial [bacterium]|nr:T9SS type A sorting domain-containing protein [bacterium]
PNPFNPTTEIRFGLPGASATTLKVYDTSGRLVRTLLANAPLAAGFHRVSWDGADARGHKSSSGLYFYVLEADGQRQTGKMTLLK